MATPMRSFIDRLGLAGGIAEWAAEEPRSLMVAWATCPRGEWLLQVAAQLDLERTQVMRAAADATSLIAPLLVDDPIGTRALAAAHGWLAGTTRAAECWAAATDAAHRAELIDADEPATAHALRSVAALAFGCDGAADAAYWASRAYVADVAHHVARAHGPASTRAHRDCADIVRDHLPYERIASAIQQIGRTTRSSGFHAVGPATLAEIEDAAQSGARPARNRAS